MSALTGLFDSRKFLVMLLDVFVSAVLYFGTRYLSPTTLADVTFLIGAYQPVFLTVIYAIAREDAALKAAGITLEEKKRGLRALLENQKFWILISQTAVSTAIYFVGHYGGEQALEDTKYLIGLLQPVGIFVIYAIAKENEAEIWGIEAKTTP